jgi:hypothetical protein
MDAKIGFAVVISLMLFGCGGDSTTGGGNSTTTESICRTYAGKIEVSGSAVSIGYPNMLLPALVECDFDTQNMQLVCQATYNDNYGSTGTQRKIWTYPTFRDFVDEGLTVGITRSKSFSFSDEGFGGPSSLIPSRPIEGTNTFDSNHRLLTSNNLIFSAWDDSGRPTASLPTQICTQDEGERFIYDDSQREVIHLLNTRTSTRPPDNTIPCIQLIIRTLFDTQGNVIGISRSTSDVDTNYRVTETKTVCMPQ